MGHHYRSKRPRISRKPADKSDLFDQLPDDLLIFLLCKLSSSASRPSDFFNLLTTCKRLNKLALSPLVLSNAGPNMLAIRAKNWSDSAHHFFKQCVNAGSSEAAYTLGMIRFYCLQNRGSGASLMAKAAIKSHPRALYSLAVIQFNGSGGSKNDKNLRAAVALCARAAFLGHINALRELGHCLQDGYGVPRNIVEGRRLLIQANARELASSLHSILLRQPKQKQKNVQQHKYNNGVDYACANGCSLLSDFGCNVPAQEEHPANQFLKEWFEMGFGGLGDGFRLCSHGGCGRPETRRHEFRRCSVCGAVNYCSRGCQALDWKLRHKLQCVPINQWHGVDVDADVDVDYNGIGGMVEIEDDQEAPTLQGN